MSFSSHGFSPAELTAILSAERRGASFLLFRDGEGALQVLGLERERLSVGREAQSDLALSWDAEVSRLHALVERLGGSWTVLDDQLSRNGTLVNGTRVRGRRRLNDMDVIQFGSTQVLYRDPGLTADETSPASSAAVVAAITAAQQRVLLALCRPFLEGGDEVKIPPSNPEIATELTVSVEAVRTQMKMLFRLFEVPDLPQNRKRAELARRALASGIVMPRDLSG